MMKHYGSIIALVLAVTLGACANRDIAVKNSTGDTLTFYGVVTAPPPPHRAAMPQRDILHTEHGFVDGDDFNPLFYQPSVASDAASNALVIQFSWDDPVTVLCRSMYYPVAPDKVGSDPQNQPTVKKDTVFNPAAGDFTIEVTRGPNEELVCTLIPGLP